jgi:hypothetical protein
LSALRAGRALLPRKIHPPLSELKRCVLVEQETETNKQTNKQTNKKLLKYQLANLAN